jgi:hypothetical protein
MGIFSNWGKNKSSDTDPQETADSAEQAKKEIEAERQAFRESLRVDTTDKPKIENSSGTTEGKPEAPDDPERTVDDEIEHDDDCVR